MRRSRRQRRIALLASASAIAIALAACAEVKERILSGAKWQVSQAKADPKRMVAGLNSYALNQLPPEVRAVVNVVGPMAVRAIEAIAAAWAARAAERREADQREEESRRLQIEEAQAFYATTCAQKEAGRAGTGPGEGGPPAAEAEAEAAYAVGDYARAAKLLQGVYDERKAHLGEKHPELARVANRLAIAYLSAGDDYRAMALAIQGLEIRKERLDEVKRGDARFKAVLGASLELAESEATVAQIYRSAGAYDEARSGYEHALKVRIQFLGEGHLCVAESQNNLGELDSLTGAYVSARRLFQRSYQARKKRLAPDHRDVAQSLDNLGSLHKAIGLYEPAREYYQKALDSRLKLGEDHPDVAHSYHNFASLHRATGEFAPAEAYYGKALAIRKKRSPEGLEVADTESSLAELMLACGDYGRAEQLLAHAHAIRKARLPSDHPLLAESLTDLAKLHLARREFDEAEQADREALALWEKKLGPDHPAVAAGLAALGEVHLASGELDRAESDLARAREIREKSLGAEHPATAESLHQLGVLYYAKRAYDRAEPLFRSALELRRKKLGENHPDVAASLSYLAVILVATDRPAEALQDFHRAQEISEQLIASVGMAAGEARIDALLRFLRAQEEVVYSLLEEPGMSARAAPLALSVALLRKGRSIDQAASISQATYRGLHGEQRAKFDELRTLRAQLARQALSPVGDARPGEAKRLTDRADQLEEELARSSGAARSRKDGPTLDDVARRVSAALSPGSVLVEVVKHRGFRFNPRPDESFWGDPRYGAMVLDGKGTVRSATLGPAAPIDDAVKLFLQRITAPSREDEGEGLAKEAGQKLEGLVLSPLRPFLAGSKGLVLSLDGQLNLVPFWALFDGKEYLIDRHDVSYVSSGRDLLRPAVARRSTTVAVLASPVFVKGAAGAARAAEDGTRGFELVEGAQAPVSQTRLAPGALKLRSPPPPLPGTEQEAKAIRRMLPRAKLMLGAEATKERFLGLQAPGIVHVATHGLFRPSSSDAAGSARGLELAGGPLTPAASTHRASEALLDSMLLWSNASTPVTIGDGAAVVLEPSGLSTALEVAGMNLWGTQLVVLSACETGRGQVDNLGQGVYGLRRAVMVAGAETLVTSLWKVDDEVTRDLMSTYYARLLAGVGRGEALRQASLAVRKKHRAPRYWAPFITIGKVGPLSAIR